MRMFALLLTVLPILTCGAPVTPEIREAAIFMYHDFVPDGESGDWAVTASVFESHVKALSDAGYTAVDFEDLRSFVLGDGDLPEKCVVLSCDDGYTGVVDIALPICEKYGMKLTCAVIGGAAERANHFVPDPSLAERMEITSHSWRIHDLPDGYRMPGCSDEAFREIVIRDTDAMTDAYARVFPEVAHTLVYPFGAFDERSEALLTELGYTVTVTTTPGRASLIRGDESTLRTLPRYGVYASTSADDILALAGNPT